jgi:hypothetical protein
MPALRKPILRWNRRNPTNPFHADFFNLVNNVNPENPVITKTSSSFVKITSAAPARQIQIIAGNGTEELFHG